jgi:hypothetical protein
LHFFSHYLDQVLIFGVCIDVVDLSMAIMLLTKLLSLF